MITSRIQFGVFGAVIPLVLVCIMYIGFSASGTVLAGQAMAKLLHINNAAGMILFSLIIIVIAVLGYRVIHKLGKVASVIGVLAFFYLFVTLLSTHDLAPLWQNLLVMADRVLPLCLRLFALPAAGGLRETSVQRGVLRYRARHPGVDDAGRYRRGYRGQRLLRQ